MNFCGVYIRSSVSWGYDDKRPAAYNIFPAPAELPFPHLECQIMPGLASPHDCALFGRECTPENAVGVCMESSEGTCKILKG